MLTTRATLPLALVVLTFASICFAEPVMMEEIVVKGAGISSTEEILTIREVRESPARDIGEAIDKVPGLTSLSKGAIAKDIVLRGLQRDNINVLMDGVRVQGGCPSRMDPPAFHFDFAEVESIEVVKGPYDTKNAGSLGGTINAIGKTPDLGARTSAVLTYGSYEQINASMTASYANEETDILAGYAYKYSLAPKAGNGKRITEIYPDTSKNRYRPDKLDDKAYDINTAWIKGSYQVTNATRTELSFAHQNAEHVLYPALFMDAEYDRTNRINWTTTVDNPSDLFSQAQLQLYWTGVDHLMHDEFRESSQPSMMITRDYMMETDAETSIFGGSLSGTAKLANGTLRSGIDGFVRNWDAVNRSAMYMMYQDQAMIPDVDHNQLGIFAEYSRPLSMDVEFKGGLRFDYAESKAGKLSAARLSSLYQPYHTTALSNDVDYFEASANLQLFWQANDDLRFFAGLASASRMPDPQELYIGLERLPTMKMIPGCMMGNPTCVMNTPSWVGNPDLDTVRNNQADLGVKLTGKSFYLNGSVFYSRIDDYISIVNIPDPDGVSVGSLSPAKTYRNLDATLWGGELAGQVSLPGDLYLSASLAYTEGENRDTNQPLAEIPPLTGDVALRYDVGTWFFEARERFADKQDRVDTSLNEAETNGWGVTDLKAGINLEQWSIIAGVNNLFDKYYFTHLSYQRDPFRTGAKVPETGAFSYLTVMYRY